MFDLKVINAVLSQLEDERGIPTEQATEAIEAALAAAYKKDFGKRGQVIRAHYDRDSGDIQFEQVKTVVDENTAVYDEEETISEDDERVRFNPEQHIELAAATLIKRDAQLGDELIFPLQKKTEFGRIAAQTAKQVILQKIREAERGAIMGDYSGLENTIVSGVVQRIEQGNVFVDLGRATAILPFKEQIKGEYFEPGERIRALLYRVDDDARGGMFLRLSRSHPRFLIELFRQESPEVDNGSVQIKAVAREAGQRAKVAVQATEDYLDPIGALVGQRGVRVSTVTSELGGEKIDIIEWAEDIVHFIEEALSPARVHDIELIEAEQRAIVRVDEDQLSLAIGRGGQNVRLAARLTGWSIDIESLQGPSPKVEEDYGTVSGDDDVSETDDSPAAVESDDAIESEVVDDTQEDKIEEVKENIVDEDSDEDSEAEESTEDEE